MLVGTGSQRAQTGYIGTTHIRNSQQVRSESSEMETCVIKLIVLVSLQMFKGRETFSKSIWSQGSSTTAIFVSKTPLKERERESRTIAGNSLGWTWRKYQHLKLWKSGKSRTYSLSAAEVGFWNYRGDIYSFTAGHSQPSADKASEIAEDMQNSLPTESGVRRQGNKL